MSVDFRSDTVTQPTKEMLAAMFSAKVGDDVLGEDPTVNQLEAYSASLFGMEAALFCPSGTMTNQIAIKCHTQPGDEVICEFLAHIYQYESGGIAFNAGCQVKTLHGDRGRLQAAQIIEAINPDDVHKAPTSLVCVENTVNRGGGSCYNINELKAIRDVCQQYKLAYHLDGARLFNAMVAKGENPQTYGKLFDSISLCLSKGLGAPVGSVLIGNKEFIKKARRIRKVFGGGMRQAGYLAAAGLYALQHHVSRLEQDHQHAATIAAELQKAPYVKTVLPVETNIIIFELAVPGTAAAFVTKLAEKGILAYDVSPSQVRIVTHLGISNDMVTYTCETLQNMTT